MGDRVATRITFPFPPGKRNFREAQELFQYLDIEGEFSSNEGETCFEFSEMNYGVIPADLKVLLDNAKLSYIWSWDDGCDFSSGEVIVLYTQKGGEWIKEVFEPQWCRHNGHYLEWDGTIWSLLKSLWRARAVWRKGLPARKEIMRSAERMRDIPEVRR